jgi:hypothetical protein
VEKPTDFNAFRETLVRVIHYWLDVNMTPGSNGVRPRTRP